MRRNQEIKDNLLVPTLIETFTLFYQISYQITLQI